VDAGSTIARSNGTFGYGHILYHESLADFLEGANRGVARVRSANDLNRATATNIIRYSALPWIDFTSISHARMFSLPDSSPWISFSKMTETGGRRSMPVSIHVHHALVDGLHVGQYIDCFQELMNEQQRVSQQHHPSFPLARGAPSTSFDGYANDVEPGAITLYLATRQDLFDVALTLMPIGDVLAQMRARQSSGAQEAG
jgi:hypothetical protein